MRRSPSRKKIVFTGILIGVWVITVELGLQVVSLVSSDVRNVLSSPWNAGGVSPTIPDARLSYRPNPALVDHDRNGFRNPNVPDQADIVALGDSQTYGTGVDSEDAWPRQLQRLGDHSVYSMAYGGYGPSHSLLLWEEAMARKPSIVIEAFYSGNDLYDSFRLVYNEQQLPDLENSDPRQVQAVLAEESAEPITDFVRRNRYWQERPLLPATESPPSGNAPGAGSLGSTIAKRSSIYGLMRRGRHELKRRLKKRQTDPEAEWQKATTLAARYPQYLQLFSSQSSRTVFASEYRLSALNLEDIRIREGLRISLQAMARMRQLAAAENIRFVVVLIPTKELVFSARVGEGTGPSYRELTRNERKIWAETVLFLRKNEIEYIDMLGPLQAQVETGPQPYPVSDDGHPNEIGHRTIARTARAYLTSQSSAATSGD